MTERELIKRAVELSADNRVLEMSAEDILMRRSSRARVKKSYIAAAAAVVMALAGGGGILAASHLPKPGPKTDNDTVMFREESSAEENESSDSRSFTNEEHSSREETTHTTTTAPQENSRAEATTTLKAATVTEKTEPKQTVRETEKTTSVAVQTAPDHTTVPDYAEAPMTTRDDRTAKETTKAPVTSKTVSSRADADSSQAETRETAHGRDEEMVGEGDPTTESPPQSADRLKAIMDEYPDLEMLISMGDGSWYTMNDYNTWIRENLGKNDVFVCHDLCLQRPWEYSTASICRYRNAEDIEKLREWYRTLELPEQPDDEITERIAQIFFYDDNGELIRLDINTFKSIFNSYHLGLTVNDRYALNGDLSCFDSFVKSLKENDKLHYCNCQKWAGEDDCPAWKMVFEFNAFLYGLDKTLE